MNKKVLLPLLPLFALSLSSCSGVNVHHNIEEYILKMDYKEDMKILQLCDIHIGDKDNRQLHYDFIDLTIKDAKPDLIVLDGDLFTFASRHTARELFNFIDSHGIPWTATFGNHDEQCYFSIDWLTGYLNDYGSNCLFKDIQDDDVFGNANFAINLMKGDEVFETIVMMDSNRYCFGEYFGYDYIKEGQIAWYEELIKYVQGNNATPIPSLAFFHIPFPEFQTAWDDYKAGSAKANLLIGEFGEKVCCPDYNSGLYAKMKELGSTKGVFCAHDHVNDYSIDYDGIVLSYGVHSTNRIYLNPDMLGGQVITLHNDNTFTLSHVLHTYAEVMNNE